MKRGQLRRKRIAFVTLNTINSEQPNNAFQVPTNITINIYSNIHTEDNQLSTSYYFIFFLANERIKIKEWKMHDPQYMYYCFITHTSLFFFIPLTYFNSTQCADISLIFFLFFFFFLVARSYIQFFFAV
jgi:hypothetical protein